MIDGKKDEGIKEAGGYVNSQIIAKLFDVSVRRIQQLTEEGIIPVEVVNVGNRPTRRYHVATAVNRYVKYLSDKAYGREESKREDELKEKKLAAEAELKESQVELHRLKTKIAVGEYISKEEVELDYSRFFVVFKKFATSLPSMISGQIASYVDPTEARKIEKDLTEQVRGQLEAFVVAGVGPEDLKEVKKRARARKKVAEV